MDISRRHLLLGASLFVLSQHVSIAAENRFYWDHPGRDPFDRAKTKPVGPSIHALLAGTNTPDAVVEQLVTMAENGPGASDALPEEGSFFFTRMNSGRGIYRNVLIRDLASPEWQHVPHEMEVYYINTYIPGKGHIIYCLARLGVCGNWAFRVFYGGQCVEDEVLCSHCLP